MHGEIGTEIGGFRIESEIGRGGMGVVYLARQAYPDRRVALKVIAPTLANDSTFRERFQRETDAAASIEHPNIVPIYGAGEVDGQLYLAMRYVEGTDLGTVIAREGPLEPARAAWICTQVAQALGAAHGRGVVHRDVKPGNVLVDADDHAYLTDFGLVRQTKVDTGVTKTGELTGTVDYVAPEQIRGEPVDGRADIYSLGCVLFECLTGEPPFRRDSEVATLYAHLESPTPRPSDHSLGIPTSLDHVVAKATAKSVDDRFQTAREFVSATSSAVRDSQPHPLPGRRRALAALLIGVGIAAALVVSIVALTGGAADEEGGASDKPPAIPLHSLVEIDPSTGTVVGAPLRMPASEGTDPAVRVGEGGIWMLATSGAVPFLIQVDPEDAEVVSDTTLTATLTVPTDSLDLGFRTVWVGTDPGIERIDPIDGDALRPVRLEQGATVAVGGGRVWAATGRGTLYRIEPATAAVDEEIETGTNAFDIAVGHGGVWIVDELDSTVSRVDVETLAVDPPINLGGDLTDIEAGAGAVWVVDERGGVVYEIGPDTQRLVNTIRVGSEPTDAALGLDAVWVANRGDGTISRIDPLTGEVAEILVGAPVAAIDVDERRGSIWVVVSPAGPTIG